MKKIIFVGLLTLLLAPMSEAVSKLVKGDQVLFFTSYAWPVKEKPEWAASIHGWNYHLESDEKRRDYLARVLAQTLKIPKEQAATEDFKRRAKWFTVRPLARRSYQVRMAGKMVKLKATGQDGHLEDQIKFPRKAGTPAVNGVTHLRLETEQWNGEDNLIPIQRIGDEGRIVIADLDDGVRITGIGRPKDVLANTFVNPFQTVPDMPALFQQWAKGDPNTVFFYVSSCPWQLYDEISRFLKKAGYPGGILKLQHFHWREQRFSSLWAENPRVRAALLEELFKHFPQRRFLLLGTSAQKDPELFGDMARHHPSQIDEIYIREVHPAIDDARYKQAFHGIDAALWHVFLQVKDLGVGL